MRKVFEIGGVVAAAVLIVFGIAAIVMGFSGRSTVHDSLKLEQIVGSADMTPAAIKAEAQQAGLPSSLKLPTQDIAGKPINSGDRARAFASYMRIHTLESTNNLTYSQMGRYMAKPGTPAKFTDGNGGTSDTQYALIDAKTQRPVENSLRNLWVTETALTTALNTSYMAEQLSRVRDRGRRRPAALGPRVRDPRRRRGAAQPGHGVRLHEEVGLAGRGGRAPAPSQTVATGPTGRLRAARRIPGLTRPADPARARTGRARRGSRGGASA